MIRRRRGARRRARVGLPSLAGPRGRLRVLRPRRPRGGPRRRGAVARSAARRGAGPGRRPARPRGGAGRGGGVVPPRRAGGLAAGRFRDGARPRAESPERGGRPVHQRPARLLRGLWAARPSARCPRSSPSSTASPGSATPVGSAAPAPVRATDLGVRVHAGQVTETTAAVQEFLDDGASLEVTVESTMAVAILLVTLVHIGLVAEAREVDALLAETRWPRRRTTRCSSRIGATTEGASSSPATAGGASA